jgi:hypothetical protein
MNPGINNQGDEKCTYLNELNARKPFLVSISQRSEGLRFYNLFRV